MRVREGRHGDRLRRRAGRAGRAEAVVVTVVACGDDGDDARRGDVPDRLDERVAGGVGLRAAAGEVDHVHAVADGRLECGHDLGRVADVADRARHVEDPVVADLSPRRDAREVLRLRVVAAVGRGRARVAGRDAGDVRAVKRRLPVDRQPAALVGSGADERAGDDHLRRRPRLAAFRESLRIAEAGRLEEPVRRVDAVVDDRDLHSLAGAAAGRHQRAGADQARTAVERERVAVARIELACEAELCRPRELGRGQLDGHAVEEDRVVAPDGGFRNRALQRRRRRLLRAAELRDVGPRGAARRVQPPGRAAAREGARVGGQRRVGQCDDDLDPALAVRVRNRDRAGADARELELPLPSLDRLKSRRRGRRGQERRAKCDESDEAAHERHSSLDSRA